MSAFDRLPTVFFYLLKEYIVPVPRCRSKLRCLNRFLSQYMLCDIKNCIISRVYLPQLHIQTRVGCLRTIGKLCTESNNFYFCSETVRKVVLGAFNSFDSQLRNASLDMLFKICERYGYYQLLLAFFQCNDKINFCKLCRFRYIKKIGKKNPVTCDKIKQLLHSGEALQVTIAICVLRSYVSLWDNDTEATIRSFLFSDITMVRLEAAQAISSLMRLKHAPKLIQSSPYFSP